MYIGIHKCIVSIKHIINFTVAEDICDYTNYANNPCMHVCTYFTFMVGISAGQVCMYVSK